MIGLYVLNDAREPVAATDLLAWSEWCFGEGSEDRRRVAKTADGDIEVSTVFLGVDHNLWPEGRPLLFETYVFGGPLNGESERYATWEEAERGHKAIVDRVTRAGVGQVE